MHAASATATRPQGAGSFLRPATPPLDLPAGYVGPAWLPGTGRMVWWTGRVAIGLRHESPRAAPAQGPAWLQEALLG